MPSCWIPDATGRVLRDDFDEQFKPEKEQTMETPKTNPNQDQEEALRSSADPETEHQQADGEDPLKLEDLANPVEYIVGFLPEAGDPMMNLRERIHEQQAQIRSIEAALKNAQGWIEHDRKRLFEMIQRNYVDSEIETADVKCTHLYRT